MIAVRFGLYLSLMLMVGLSAFPLYALRDGERLQEPASSIWPPIIACLCVAMILSLVGLVLLIAAMTGAPIAKLDWETSRLVLLDTDTGTAWIVRMGALLLALASSLVRKWTGRSRLLFVLCLGAVALSTLVWTGHAGATEGSAGTVHRASDVIHMLSASVWVGGIGAFLLILRMPPDGLRLDSLEVAHRALEGFSRVGTICVAAIAATGMINGQILLGFANLGRLPYSTYGQLLILKLLLMGVMLALAANNRWRLTPRLGAAMVDGDFGKGTAALRYSLWLEALAGATILGLVAWFGMLDPTAAAISP